MQVFESIRKTEYNSCVALGFFDGVHTGHKEVLKTCLSNATGNTKSVVLTFNENPASFTTGVEKPLLTTNEQKLGYFEKLGIDTVFCINFAEIMNLSAEQFVREILVDMLCAKTVVTGFNYHFGKGGTADADDLKNLLEKYGINAIKCPPVMYNDTVISSSRIRECISNGEIEDANKMLSYNFSINTAITSGNHIGTKINSPTINQVLNNKIVTPKFGVYATKVTVNGNEYFGATNIGTHPTVGQCTPVCETHLLDFESGDLHNEKISTELLSFLRPEQKFDTIDMLKAQIEKDKKAILSYFNK